MEFFASTNPGEPLKPLARIASTGEMSRFMLALKVVLAEADHQAGEFTLTWNGRDGAGRPVGAGLYFARLQADDLTASRKMILVR